MQTGWGANCNVHKDPHNRKARCTCQLSFKPRGKPELSEAQVLAGLKRWLIFGVPIVSAEGHSSQLHAHKAMDPYDCAVMEPAANEDLDRDLALLAPH